MAHTRVLRELREDCDCQNCKYCPLEVLVKSMGDRLLEQHKMVEKFKFERGAKLKREIDWDEAYQMWITDGYAKKFAEVYNEEKTFRQLYKEINPV
jgi:aromatic ring hydroxylase